MLNVALSSPTWAIECFIGRFGSALPPPRGSRLAHCLFRGNSSIGQRQHYLALGKPEPREAWQALGLEEMSECDEEPMSVWDVDSGGSDGHSTGTETDETVMSGDSDGDSDMIRGGGGSSESVL